jgi:hypothetical protein
MYTVNAKNSIEYAVKGIQKRAYQVKQYHKRHSRDGPAKLSPPTPSHAILVVHDADASRTSQRPRVFVLFSILIARIRTDSNNATAKAAGPGGLFHPGRFNAKKKKKSAARILRQTLSCRNKPV